MKVALHKTKQTKPKKNGLRSFCAYFARETKISMQPHLNYLSHTNIRAMMPTFPSTDRQRASDRFFNTNKGTNYHLNPPSSWHQQKRTTYETKLSNSRKDRKGSRHLYCNWDVHMSLSHTLADRNRQVAQPHVSSQRKASLVAQHMEDYMQLPKESTPSTKPFHRKPPSPKNKPQQHSH